MNIIHKGARVATFFELCFILLRAPSPVTLLASRWLAAPGCAEPQDFRASEIVRAVRMSAAIRFSRPCCGSLERGEETLIAATTSPSGAVIGAPKQTP